MQKGFSEVIKKLRMESKREDGLMDTSTFPDVLKYNVAIQENAAIHPNRSWYQEWFANKIARDI